TYQFEVDGETYEGDQLNLRGTLYLGSEEGAAALLTDYPTGTEVTLFTDPADPTRSVLDRSVQSGTWWLVGTGVILLALSTMLAVARFTVTTPERTTQTHAAGN
ncbi:MAG: DUF3592 domain-containing protein, partial [Chloroflexota bacterium]